MLNPEFMQWSRAMANTDISQAANYIVATAIARHPKATFPNRAETAFSILVDVNYAFVQDSDFDAVIESYVLTLNNIYQQLVKDFPGSADAIFANMVKTMTMKYSM